MPLGKGVRYRVRTTKTGKKVRFAFRGKGKVVEAMNMKTGATHTPAEFAQEADDMGQVHVGLQRASRQPRKSLGKFVVLIALTGLLAACATVDPVQRQRAECWARGGYTVETADQGFCALSEGGESPTEKKTL